MNLAAPAVVVLCAALTACGPRGTDARVGVTVDERGNPVLVLQDCEGIIDTLEVDIGPPPTPSVTPPPGPPRSTLTRKKPVKGITRIPLLAGGDGWSAPDVVPVIRAVDEVQVQSRSRRKSAIGGFVTFTRADLNALEPGQVRHDVPTEPGISYRTTPVRDFPPDKCS